MFFFQVFIAQFEKVHLNQIINSAVLSLHLEIAMCLIQRASLMVEGQKGEAMYEDSLQLERSNMQQ